MRVLAVTTDYRNVKSNYPIDEDTGEPIRDFSRSMAAFPMKDETVKDEDGNDVIVKQYYPESDSRHYYCAVVIEWNNQREPSAGSTIYEYSQSGINQAKSEHPSIEWSKLGIFAGDPCYV